jgi:hypothetical protein
MFTQAYHTHKGVGFNYRGFRPGGSDIVKAIFAQRFIQSAYMPELFNGGQYNKVGGPDWEETWIWNRMVILDEFAVPKSLRNLFSRDNYDWPDNDDDGGDKEQTQDSDAERDGHADAEDSQDRDGDQTSPTQADDYDILQSLDDIVPRMEPGNPYYIPNEAELAAELARAVGLPSAASEPAMQDASDADTDSQMLLQSHQSQVRSSSRTAELKTTSQRSSKSTGSSSRKVVANTDTSNHIATPKGTGDISCDDIDTDPQMSDYKRQRHRNDDDVVRSSLNKRGNETRPTPERRSSLKKMRVLRQTPTQLPATVSDVIHSVPAAGLRKDIQNSSMSSGKKNASVQRLRKTQNQVTNSSSSSLDIVHTEFASAAGPEIHSDIQAAISPVNTTVSGSQGDSSNQKLKKKHSCQLRVPTQTQ